MQEKNFGCATAGHEHCNLRASSHHAKSRSRSRCGTPFGMRSEVYYSGASPRFGFFARPRISLRFAGRVRRGCDEACDAAEKRADGCVERLLADEVGVASDKVIVDVSRPCRPRFRCVDDICAHGLDVGCGGIEPSPELNRGGGCANSEVGHQRERGLEAGAAQTCAGQELDEAACGAQSLRSDGGPWWDEAEPTRGGGAPLREAPQASGGLHAASRPRSFPRSAARRRSRRRRGRAPLLGRARASRALAR